MTDGSRSSSAAIELFKDAKLRNFAEIADLAVASGRLLRSGVMEAAPYYFAAAVEAGNDFIAAIAWPPPVFPRAARDLLDVFERRHAGIDGGTMPSLPSDGAQLYYEYRSRFLSITHTGSTRGLNEAIETLVDRGDWVFLPHALPLIAGLYELDTSFIESLINKISGGFPENAAVHSGFARLYNSLAHEVPSSEELAMERRGSWLERFPEAGHLRYQYADFERQHGRLIEAERLANEVVTLCPTHGWARELLHEVNKRKYPAPPYLKKGLAKLIPTRGYQEWAKPWWTHVLSRISESDAAQRISGNDDTKLT